MVTYHFPTLPQSQFQALSANLKPEIEIELELEFGFKLELGICLPKKVVSYHNSERGRKC